MDRFNRDAGALARIHADAPRTLIANLDTRVALLQAGDCTMPVTVNDGEAGNAWICSPLTTYSHYAAEELQRYAGHAGRPLAWLLHGFGRHLRAARIDRAVALNNWLVSTNLYPAFGRVPLPQLLAQARLRWPGHALWFRSLNREQHAHWLDALAAAGFMLIPSRQVYLFDDLRDSARRHADMRRDMKLLRGTPLLRVGNDAMRETDYARIAALYAQLYLDKYSRFNPHYTAAFIAQWHRAGLLHLGGFRDDAGILQAALGMFRQHGTVTAPIVGYNTALPQSLGLYRLTMASVFEHAMQHGGQVNLSAGAAHFKRQRGGRAAIEYSAVYARHLPATTQRALAVLRWATTTVGVPVMRRFKL